MSKFVLSAFADEISPDLKTQMEVLESYGIEYIEIRGVNGSNLTKYTLDEVKIIKKKLDERNFKLSSIGSPIGKINITDVFESHLKLFKHTLEIAKIMETKYIRVFSFFIPEGEDAIQYRNMVMDRWIQFVRLAEESGIILLHENEKGIYGDNPGRCLDLIETANSPCVKAVFDPANFVQCGVDAYPNAFELLKKYVEYVHIKDALSSDHRVVPAGFGDGKVKEVLRALYNSGYEGFLSLEPHLGDFVGFSELESSSPANKLPEGGPKQFAIALEALQKILNEIQGT